MYAESELILNNDGSVFHLHLRPEQLAERVILVGDQNRVQLVAGWFDQIECEVQNREFHTITGVYKGKRLSVVSTGIGTDNIDIVLTELDALSNIDLGRREDKPGHTRLQLVRIGTSGGLQPSTPEGTFVASAVSIGFDGLLNYYADRDRVSDLAFEQAFVEQTAYNQRFAAPYCVHASQSLLQRIAGSDMLRGATISAPGFYGPQGRCIRMPLADPALNDKIRAFSHGGLQVTNFEMEGSAIAGMSAVLGHDALTVCLIIANRYGKRFIGDYNEKMKELIQLVLNRL